MPATQNQTNANRKNANKSTGPKTKTGKQKSARNAVRHGLYSKDVIINSPYLKESNTEYNDLLNSLFEDLKPQGIFQEQLVLKIANSLWRSRRIAKAETAQINSQLDDISYHTSLKNFLGRAAGETDDQYDDSDNLPDDPDDQLEDSDDHDHDHDHNDNPASDTDNLIGIKSIPNDTFSRNILRYEMRLDRQLSRTLRLLTNLQRIAHQEPDPKPLRGKKNHPKKHKK